MQRLLYWPVGSTNWYLGGNSEGPSICPDRGEIPYVFIDAVVLFIAPRESNRVGKEIQSQTAHSFGVLDGVGATR